MKPGRKAKFSEVTKVIRIPESREKEVLLYLNKVPKGKARAVMALIEKHLDDLSDEDEPPPATIPTDGKILDAAIDDLPAPIPTDSQILEALPVQTDSIDPTIAQSKINGVAAVVARFEAIKKTETSPRWEKAVQFIRDIKEALK